MNIYASGILHNNFLLLWFILHIFTNLHFGWRFLSALFRPLPPKGGVFLNTRSEYTNIYVYIHACFSAAGQWKTAARRTAVSLSYTIFSGRTVSSNSSEVSRPRDSTASFNVVPSARAFLAHLAAAS